MLFISFENFQETLESKNIFPFYCSILLVKNHRKKNYNNIIVNYSKKYRYVYLINFTLSVSEII